MSSVKLPFNVKRKQRCENCSYFTPDPEEEGKYSPLGGDGQCTYKDPNVHHFQRASHTNWCDKWKKKG